MRRVNLLLSFEVYLFDGDPIPAAVEEIDLVIWDVLGALCVDITIPKLMENCCIRSVESVCDGCGGVLPFHLRECPHGRS